ncbi:MAG: flavin reductase family protein [Cytophagales bacterium]|nr:flavin reductase family protein [Cytophagales bacterium]
MYKTINLENLSARETYQWLSSSVTPRPIALVSSMSREGAVNLSPFSFFNLFSVNPPMLVFSPLRTIRSNEVKDTLNNVREVAEAVIHLVSYDMAEQVSLASMPFESSVNEFEKAGFAAVQSDAVRPPRVKEAPAAFECRVNEVKELGRKGGSGHLVICEVLRMHVDERILTGGLPDPQKLDVVSRMGGDWYCRSDSLFRVAKPETAVGVGVDSMPEAVRLSSVLTGNHLGKLGVVSALPNARQVGEFAKENRHIIEQIELAAPERQRMKTHLWAVKLLEDGCVDEAWKALLWAEDVLAEV